MAAPGMARIQRVGLKPTQMMAGPTPLGEPGLLDHFLTHGVHH